MCCICFTNDEVMFTFTNKSIVTGCSDIWETVCFFLSLSSFYCNGYMVWHMWNSFYIGYVLAFPTTYVYIDAQEIMRGYSKEFNIYNE